jgi:hypothetical protein
MYSHTGSAEGKNQTMNRREFFSLSAGAALVPTKMEATEDIDCERHAANLAAAMKAKYGGAWRFNIEPDHGFVVVVRDD